MAVQRAYDLLRERDRLHDCSLHPPGLCLRIAASAELPTRFGDFWVVAFTAGGEGLDHAAFIHGDAIDGEAVPVRLHSECLTGDAIGSLRCDCRDQLHTALNAIGQMDHGILLYLRQEGRGIGLANKIRAYELQDHGLDTVDANHALGFRDDERDYSVAVEMLRALGVRSVKLMTNNPRKIAGLEGHGITIAERIPLVSAPTDFNRDYLATKAVRSGHLMGATEFGDPEQEDWISDSQTDVA